MRITLHSSTNDFVKWLINDKLSRSRFNAKEIKLVGRNSLEIKRIRLDESKSYCGNHPNSCELRPFGGGREPKGVWLEGADWVEFNDMINDILDQYDISANVYTIVCKIRFGRERRINYDSHLEENFYQWDLVGDREEDYEDWCGDKQFAPNSTFPEGTPGKYTRLGANYDC